MPVRTARAQRHRGWRRGSERRITPCPRYLAWGEDIAAPQRHPPQIAFDSFRDGNWEVYVMNEDGSAPTNLTNHPAIESGPAWSPDGKRIAFSSSRDGDAEIYVMNADGTAPIRLTTNAANDYYPAWSPDGNRIAFSSYRDGNDEIY